MCDLSSLWLRPPPRYPPHSDYTRSSSSLSEQSPSEYSNSIPISLRISAAWGLSVEIMARKVLRVGANGSEFTRVRMCPPDRVPRVYLFLLSACHVIPITLTAHTTLPVPLLAVPYVLNIFHQRPRTPARNICSVFSPCLKPLDLVSINNGAWR